MGYKATTNFSFDGKNYVEGQEVNYDDEVVIEKLKSRGQISSGSGKSAEDVQKEADEASAKKSAAADAKRKKEADDREKEYVSRQGKPKVNTSLDSAEKNAKAGPNEPKK